MVPVPLFLWAVPFFDEEPDALCFVWCVELFFGAVDSGGGVDVPWASEGAAISTAQRAAAVMKLR